MRYNLLLSAIQFIELNKIKLMTPNEINSANEYMAFLFNSKDPIKARTRTVLIWDEEGYVNWLAFNLAMFKYFDTDKFTDEQAKVINDFKESVKGKDGHDPYYDFNGNSLKNIHGTLKEGACKLL
jgi:hypothetical protein